jgi:hypothetical protein
MWRRETWAKHAWRVYGVLWAVFLAIAGLRWFVPTVMGWPLAQRLIWGGWLIFVAGLVVYVWIKRARSGSAEHGIDIADDEAEDETADETATESEADGEASRLGRSLTRATDVIAHVNDKVLYVAMLVWIVAVVHVAIRYTLTWSWAPGRLLCTATLFVLCLWTLLPFTSSAFRTGFMRGADSLAFIIAAMALVAVTAAGAFAGVTHELLHWTDTTLTDPSGKPVEASPDGLIGFYYWNLFDALPGQPATKLQIDAPYDYTSAWIGALLLLYSILVIIPLLAWFGSLAHWRRLKSEDA